MHSSYNKPLDVETLNINSRIYNKKFKKEDGDTSRRSIVVLGKKIPEKYDIQEVLESYDNLIDNIKRIRSQLKEGEYVGLIYAPFEHGGHADSFIISQNHVFATTSHNMSFQLACKVGMNFMREGLVSLDTKSKFDDNSIRAIQSDNISCGAVGLKVIKTLLSKTKDGRLLIETLPIKNGSIEMPTDILKISQSEKLVQEKIKNIPKEKRVLLTGKHVDMPLEEHRLKFERILNDDSRQSSYVDRLREKYIERANNPKLLAEKMAR